jgi:hypothetical protein
MQIMNTARVIVYGKADDSLFGCGDCSEVRRYIIAQASDLREIREL